MAAAIAVVPFVAPAQAQDQVLKMVPVAPLRVLDPLTNGAYVTRNHGYMIYDTLFGFDENYVAQPQMVDTWSVSDDGLTYKFTLRDGLKFHDGAPVTAEDAVASLSRWFNRDVTGGQIKNVLSSITADDEKSFTIVLKQPFRPLVDSLAKPSVYVPFIMPKRIIDKAGDGNIEEYIGSGPYRFLADEFRPGVSAAYEKFDGYVPRSEPSSYMSGKKEALIKRVEWLNFPDNQTLANALIKGEIDLVESLSSDTISMLEGAQGVKYGLQTGSYTPMLRMNWLQKPLDNVKIRQAVASLMSQEEFMAALVGDPETYEICGSLYACKSPFSTDANALSTGAPDVEKAKALLKEGGYNGEKIVILDVSDVLLFRGYAAMTAQYLREAGMNVEVQTMDLATMFAQRSKQVPLEEGGWSIAFGVWDSIDLFSPIVNLNLDTRGTTGYAGWANDQQVADLKAEFTQAETLDEQKAIAEKIQVRANDLVFGVPLGTFRAYMAYRDNISTPLPAPVPVFWGIEKK